MADYVRINQYDRGGELAISRNVFAKLALSAVKHANVKSDVAVKEPIKVVFKKDGRVLIKLHVAIKKGVKPTEISMEIQKEIAHALEVYVESVPFEIEISVDEIR